MKIRKWLMLAAPLAMTVGTMPIILTACNTDEMPVVYSAEKRNCPYYAWNMTSPITGEGIYVKQSGFNINITEFNGSHVPYVDLDEYLQVMKNYYCAVTADYKTVVCSMFNNEFCIIDYKKQTITFSDWDRFISSKTSYGPQTQGCGGGENYFNKVEVKTYHPGTTQTLNLKDYNLKAYYYQDNTFGSVPHGYIPYHLLNNIFNINLVYPLCDYNGYGMYTIEEDNNPYPFKAVKAAARTGFYNAEYMEYCYNMMAVSLDCRFGLHQRYSRANKGKVITYLKDGAYAALKPFHDRIVSTNDDVSSDALREFYTKELDDGGHAGYYYLNAHSTKPFDVSKVYGSETTYTFDIDNKVLAAKSAKAITNGYQEYTNGSGNKIAYITFNSFDAPRSTADWTQEERDAERELPSGTTDANYMNDTLRMTMYANDKIQKDANIKDVVIDLSTNGGGTVYTEHFIASWLLGGVTEKIYNPTTGAYTEYEVKADINGDGEFNDQDRLASDVNLFVITSSSSFSCGNMLPCNIADHANQRTGKTIIMGNRSGGGACFVDQLFLGSNTLGRNSSTFHMLRKDSRYGHYVSNDIGGEVTTGWEFDEVNTPEQFADRDAINTKIWSLN